jgi:hypothetical protein
MFEPVQVDGQREQPKFTCPPCRALAQREVQRYADEKPSRRNGEGGEVAKRGQVGKPHGPDGR